MNRSNNKTKTERGFGTTRHLIIGAVLGLALATSVSADDKVPAAKPNVLFIAVDDLNDWVGCMSGHPQTRTPNIDRLAKSGVLFTNAYCAAPSCNPSRSAIMSGLPPYRTGLYQNPRTSAT